MRSDPIGLAGIDPNIYGYALNDPINLIDPEGLFIGSILSRGFGKVVGRTAQEAAVAGQISDSMVSATLGLMGISTLPQSSYNIIQGGVLALQGWGAYASASLALATVGTAPVAFPLALSFAAGVEIGLLIDKIPVYGTNETIGSWYGNYFFELMHKKDNNPCN